MEGPKRLVTGISIIVVCLVVSFLGLRVYGVYRNEKLGALASAAKAERVAASEQARVDGIQKELDCSLAWQDYKLAMLDARYAQLKQGDLAYYKAKIRADRKKPLCGGGALSFDTFGKLLADQLEHQGQAWALHSYSERLTEYANNQKLQTAYLAHRFWLALTGTHAAQDDLAKFLARNQPKSSGDQATAPQVK